MQSTDILELVPDSVTLTWYSTKLHVQYIVIALLRAPVIALNKEAATSNMAIKSVVEESWV